MPAFYYDLQPWMRVGLVFATAALAALLLHLLVFRGIARLSRRMPSVLFARGALLTHLRSPARLLLPVLALYGTIPLVGHLMSDLVRLIVLETLYVLLIVGLAWTLIGLTKAVEDQIAYRFDIGREDNLRARKVQTQFRILKRIVVVAVGILALSAILLRHDEFRELGAGLIASAGIAGIILGLAAQRTIGNLLAGFQIAITQPIRVDDVVIVEDEWGWIEEITLTYVVVRIWDLRRLILPISYFIEKPFENWTHTSANLLGTVFLYTDYSVPVDALREELQRLAEASDLWDGKVCVVHVTNVTEKTMEVRALVSASSAPRAFELRAALREQLVTFLQTHYPGSLPTVRARFQDPQTLRQLGGGGTPPAHEPAAGPDG